MTPARRSWALFLLAAVLLASLAPAPLRAATLPSGFVESLVSGGLSAPTAMAFAPDGRLFVCQQSGQLRVIKNGVLLATPFLTVTVDPSGERGLLGIAFDPDFATNQYVYVYYTATSPAVHNRVSRFTANGDIALPGSEFVVLDLNSLSGATNHNGGAMHFGSDGKLYIAVGENANGANSQTLGNLLGKILRINADGTIPTDNPFYNTASGVNRVIWAYGLRNPFTFAFQPGTSRMFINDVGQSTWEEIDEGFAGANYGWSVTEGPTSDPRFVTPIYYYGRDSGCAITGGTFYNPGVAQFPASYVGSYFFADFCSGWIRRLDPANGNAVTGFATGILSPVDLKVGPDGALYYLARGSGAVYKIEYRQRGNDALFVSQNVPTSMLASRTYSVSVTMQNTGANTWTPESLYRLGSQNPQDTTIWGTHRVPLPPGASVAPGQQITIPFLVTAPGAGTFAFQWKMVQDLVEWFGQPSPSLTISVTGSTPTTNGVNAARFVSQNVPATMLASRSYSVSVTMQNTGTSTWTSDNLYRLGSQSPQDNTMWGTHRMQLPAGVSVAPGQQVSFTFLVTAPGPGVYRFQWRMVQDLVQWFGETTPSQNITVTAP